MAQSCPGPRRRRVSQPSPMFAGAPRHDHVVLARRSACRSRRARGRRVGWRPDRLHADRAQPRPVHGDVAVDAQARDAAVGEDVQATWVHGSALVDSARRPTRKFVGRALPEPGEEREGATSGPAALDARNFEEVVAVSTELRLWQDRRPRRSFSGEVGLRERPPSHPRVDRAMRRVVAGEKAGVHVDAADHGLASRARHAPIVSRRSPPPRLPAVHPLAASRELAGHEHGRLRLDEIRFRREKIVVRRQRASADA